MITMELSRPLTARSGQARLVPRPRWRPTARASAIIDAADYSVWRDNVDALGVVESSALTQVQFGGNPADPIYNASTQRSITLAGDAYDARITVVAPAAIVATAVPEPRALLVAIFALLVVRTFSRDAPFNLDGIGERVAPA